jgi:hypothetical protein
VNFLSANIDNDFADSRTSTDQIIGFADRFKCEMARVEARHDLARFTQSCHLAQDLSMVRTPFPAQYRQQCKHARIGRRSERQGRKCMGSPAERTNDMSKARDGSEGRIENGTSHRVVNEIKAPARAVLGDAIGDRRFIVVDKGGAELFNITTSSARAKKMASSATMYRAGKSFRSSSQTMTARSWSGTGAAMN